MKGETNQNLGRNLPLNESRMTATQFDDYLMKSHELDPENFMLGSVTIAGDDGPVNWPVIIGEHPLKRMDERTFMVSSDIMRKTTAVLANRFVARTVTTNRISWDDEADKAVEFDNDGILATTVKVEASNMVYVFECGLSYIRLATLWMGDVDKFAAHDSVVIRITKDGLFEREA